MSTMQGSPVVECCVSELQIESRHLARVLLYVLLEVQLRLLRDWHRLEVFT